MVNDFIEIQLSQQSQTKDKFDVKRWIRSYNCERKAQCDKMKCGNWDET